MQVKSQKTVTKLRVGDSVIVISGKDKKKTGKILFISRKKEKVIVKGIALRKRLVKNQENPKGTLTEIESPIHISNVMYYLEKEKVATRLYFVQEEGGKKRFSTHLGAKV